MALYHGSLSSIRGIPIRTSSILNSRMSHQRCSLVGQTRYVSIVSSQPQVDHRTYDLVVVGHGISGLSAALSAAEKGASVLLLDRDHGGGASALSGGVVYAGGGTKQQRAAQIQDDAENMFNYLKLEVGDCVREQTLRRFCDGSVGMLEWLEKHGARFEGSLCPWKCGYPNDQYYLYYSGNEKVYPFNKHAKPAARGHRFVKPGIDSGSGLWEALTNSAKKWDIQFKHLCHAESLIMNNGRVSGLNVQTVPQDTSSFAKHKKNSMKAKKYWLSAPGYAAKCRAQANQIRDDAAIPEVVNAKSVLLAAGGFAFNRDWVLKFAAPYKNVAPIGSGDDVGFGITLGQSVGGTISHMDKFTCWRFLSPPSPLLRGVALGLNGERVAAEDQYGARFSESLIHQHDGKGFLILDSEIFASAKSRVSTETDFPLRIQALWLLYWAYFRARTLDELAEKINVPASAMKETIQAYNDGIRTGKGDPHFKEPEHCQTIVKPPFYAIDISVRDSGIQLAPGLSLGGLRVDEESGLVLNNKGNIIDGLYSAGRNAVGVCSNQYISGLSLADCVFSGRRAGEHAALTARDIKP